MTFALLCSVGCKDKSGGTYPVSVKVTLDSASLEGATVLLSEVSGSKSAVGITNASGVANIKSTEGWDGVFPGEYNVVIKKTEITYTTTPPAGTEVDRSTPPEEEQRYSITRELLPAKYGKESTSGLKLSHVNQKETFEFDLSANP